MSTMLHRQVHSTSRKSESGCESLRLPKINYCEEGPDLLGILSPVVGRRHFDIQNITQHQILIVTDTLHKHQLDSRLTTLLLNPESSLLGRIRCIEDANHTTLLPIP